VGCSTVGKRDAHKRALCFACQKPMRVISCPGSRRFWRRSQTIEEAPQETAQPDGVAPSFQSPSSEQTTATTPQATGLRDTTGRSDTTSAPVLSAASAADSLSMAAGTPASAFMSGMIPAQTEVVWVVDYRDSQQHCCGGFSSKRLSKDCKRRVEEGASAGLGAAALTQHVALGVAREFLSDKGTTLESAQAVSAC
jgi:hypothetical protein